MKHRNRLHQALLLALLVTFIGSAGAQDTVVISGKVTSLTENEGGLLVTLNRMTENQTALIGSTQTTPSGNYRFEAEPGRYLINVTLGDNTYHKIADVGYYEVDFELTGIIRGRVNHATSTVPPDLTVSLVSDYNTVCATTQADEAGYFEFSNVNLAENHTVRVYYMYVEYSSDNIAAGKSPATANVTIFDSTTEDTFMQVMADHIIIGQDFNGPWVQEYVQFANTGNKSYYGPDGVYVGIGTPLKIKDLQTEIMDCCMVREEGRLWIDPMDPILPGGTTEATISYYLDTDKKEFIFEKNILHPGYYLMVFADADSGITIKDNNILTETQNLEGRNYQVLKYAHPRRDDTIRFTIGGYTLPGKNSSGSEDWLVYSGLGILIIGLLAYPFITRGRQAVMQESDTHEHIPASRDVSSDLSAVENLTLEELESEKLTVFEQLRELDYMKEDGQVSDDEYENLRAQHKSRALSIIQQIKKFKAPLNSDEAGSEQEQ